MIEGYHRSRI